MSGSGSTKRCLALLMIAMACCSASGQLVVVGCANGSCNPSADGGVAISTTNNQQSTTVEQPAQDAGGNPLVDLLGVLGPLAPLVKPGRKLMGHQVTAADSANMRQLRQLPGLPAGTVIAGCMGNSCNPTADGGVAISTTNNQQSTTVEQPAQEAGGNPLIDLIGVLAPFAPLVAGGGRKLTADADSTNMRQLRQLPTGLPAGTIIAGCMGNSCNPTATGGTAISTSQTTQNTEIKPAPQEPASNPIEDIFKGIGDIFEGR